MGKQGEADAPGSQVDGGLEALVLEKVDEVCSAIDSAKKVDQVICALHSLAVLLFPVDSSVISGTFSSSSEPSLLAASSPSDSERDAWKHAFYHGTGFPAMCRVLIYNVTSNWLRCFPALVRELVYDPFFLEGPTIEIIQMLVPALNQNGSRNKSELSSICSNIERLLVFCLLENDGVHRMVQEFALLHKATGNFDESLPSGCSLVISRVAQLLASIPDKATIEALPLLSSHSFFRHIVTQLLDGAQERYLELHGGLDTFDLTIPDSSLLFLGETFSRICRRGSADILVDAMIPRILDVVHSCLPSNSSFVIPSMFKKNPKSQFWSRIMETIKDRYAVERLSEVLLRQLSTISTNEMEAYWVLWLLFHKLFKHGSTMRAMFVDKFLIWKVFPVNCLRWIIQFSTLEHPPDDNACSEYSKTKEFFSILQQLVTVWSKRDFVQSARLEQQAYISAAVGLCLERMTKEELETAEDVLPSILQGVSCRLESPIPLVRKMGTSIAFAFSKVVDPANPLYLDDDHYESIDWEFGLLSVSKEQEGVHTKTVNTKSKVSHVDLDHTSFDRQKSVKDSLKHSSRKHLERTKIDTDKPTPIILEIGHPNDANSSDDESQNSETSSDSSLQPYDLSDDDSDLQKGFSQLDDVSVALRKPDDPDAIIRALDVAEKLIRASPDELHHSSGDLVRALVHVRCFDAAIEGQEHSAEVRRQNALVALIVTCPFECLDVLTKLIYSPNVDVGQRILMIDVMTEAAQELAGAMSITSDSRSRSLVSSISANQPWFLPSSNGRPGASPWKEIDEVGGLNWSHKYEREVPSRPGEVKKGKSRRWSLAKAREFQPEHTKNKFPLYAAAFMLPIMQGYDRRRHGVDLLNRDFIVLGKLIHMLGVCMNCMAMHPEASTLGPHLLDMLRSREVAHHAEAYVRRAVIFAASSILIALHPSFVASALIEGNSEISSGLEWIRTWALHIADSDPDTDCSTMAMKCLQLHSEMALQISRTLEAAESYRPKVRTLPSKSKDIILPFGHR
ncbi:putative protein phosphatase 2C 19 [Apostasia shenzhenica]|uniref:Uncharacterized protein n=1 Tax=Apostasia shenzhenica TaxID=1088818 RepID=A0A2I0A3D4_9ASPA|nr:putative protein phosphatase 2C 19 [Apostasia shenzhenica]